MSDTGNLNNDDVIIKWVPVGTEKDHDGWRVIGKPKQGENGQLLVPLARDDGNVYVQFDEDPTMFGVAYEVDMDKLKTHPFDDLMTPIREIGLPQYYILPNMKRAIDELSKMSDEERRKFYYGEFIDEDSEKTSGETMDEKRKKAYEYIKQKIQEIPLHNDPFSAVPLAWQRFIEIDIADNGGWLFKPKDNDQLTEEDIEELLNRLEAEARHWQIPEDDEGNSNG